MSTNRTAPVEPFNPMTPGTPEHCWEELLRTVPEWRPDGRPLLVVSPHPDDEVLAVGGLMRMQALAGAEVSVLSVTDGAAAYSDWAGLDQVRRSELQNALCLLGGGRINLVHLGLADGRVAALRRTLHEAVSRHLTRRPTLVAPYEIDGHPDHDATGSVCAELARLHSLPLLRYPVWTWHHAAPEALVDARWARLPLDGATRDAKARAIDCFASQLRPPGRQPIVPAHVLTYFTRSYEAYLL